MSRRQKFIPALKSKTLHLDFFILKPVYFTYYFRPKIYIQIFEYIFFILFLSNRPKILYPKTEFCLLAAQKISWRDLGEKTEDIQFLENKIPLD